MGRRRGGEDDVEMKKVLFRFCFRELNLTKCSLARTGGEGELEMWDEEQLRKWKKFLSR